MVGADAAAGLEEEEDGIYGAFEGTDGVFAGTIGGLESLLFISDVGFYVAFITGDTDLFSSIFISGVFVFSIMLYAIGFYFVSILAPACFWWLFTGLLFVLEDIFKKIIILIS